MAAVPRGEEMIKVNRTFTKEFVIEDDVLDMEIPETSLREYLERKTRREANKVFGLEDNYFVWNGDARWSWDSTSFFVTIDVEFLIDESEGEIK
jgi:hypothetical protein